MLLAVFFTIFTICKEMGWSFGEMVSAVASTENPKPELAGTQFSDLFDWRWGAGTNAVKQFVAGIFMTVAMTGLDQGMIQKSLACKDIRSAQKNMYTTSIIAVVANYFFLLLGAILSIYVAHKGGFEVLGISKPDDMFPTIASSYLGVGIGIVFLIGLISASYPSAGGALTSLTTSFCVDFVGFNTRNDLSETRKESLRKKIHAGFTFLFFIIILILFVVSNDAVVNLVYKLASYTYGPLLGIFFFGILTNYKVKDRATPYIAVAAPVLCFMINFFGKKYLDFDLGFTLLIVNGLLTFFGMWLFRKKN
jgi:Na+/proline symporter